MSSFLKIKLLSSCKTIDSSQIKYFYIDFMAQFEEIGTQKVFNQILTRLSNRSSFSPYSSHFYITMRQTFKKDGIRQASKSMAYEKPQKSPQKKNHSSFKGNKCEEAFNQTFVTIKNARYHIGKEKNYQIQNLQFPSFGKKSPKKNKMNFVIEQPNHVSKQLTDNKSRLTDSELKMSWNRYMNITGFKRSYQQQHPIQQDQSQYINNMIGKQNQQKKGYRIRNGQKKDKTEEQLVGWNNFSYHQEQIVIRK